MRILVLAFALTLFSGAANAQSPPRPALVMNTLRVGSIDRSIGLYVPHSLRAGQPAPLIIALHGRFSSAQALHAISHLGTVSEQNGAIVAYPETALTSWNDGGFEALARTEAPADDVGFMAAAIDAIAQDFPLDRRRVYVVGYDSGGAMAYALACHSSLHLAGVAAISAPMFDFTQSACANARATPMLIMHGDRDDIFPSAGLTLTAPQHARLLSSAETISFWGRINGCGEATGASFAGSCSGAPFSFVSVSGGAHDWFHVGPDYQLNRQGVDAAAAIGAFFFNTTVTQQPRGPDTARGYVVYVPPSYNPSRPTPLVILMHGSGGSPLGMAQISHMNAVAARHGFIVVYPQGFNHEWNAYFDLVHQPAIAPQDDITFLKRLTEDLSVDLNIDRRRMYVSGFSNGGFMTLRLACSASDYFAGFASIVAELYTQLTSRCRGDGAPIMLVNGTADPAVPYNGVLRGGTGNAGVHGNLGAAPLGGGMPSGTTNGASSGIGNPLAGDQPVAVTLSAFETANFFVHRNHCDATGASTSFRQRGQSPGTSVTRFAPHNCANHNDVAFYIVQGGGHEWPGGPQRDSAMGITNQDIDTGEEMWAFFSAHALDHDPR